MNPYYKTLASQFEPLDDVLPMQSIPFALSPSGLIPSPRFSEFSPSPALVQHLRSILPEYIPSDPQPPPDPESDSNSVKAPASTESTSGQQSTGGFALPTIPMPAVNLNMDMRGLKWNWPGYLTFGKNSKDKEKQKKTKGGGDERIPGTPEPESKPDSGEGGSSPDTPVTDGDVSVSDPPSEGEKIGVEVEVDAVSLAEAMELENRHGGSSGELSPGTGTPSEAPPSPTARTIRPTPDEDATPTTVQPVDAPTSQGADEASHQPSSVRSPSPTPEESPPGIPEPPPPPAAFSHTPVHLAPPGQPLQTTKRRVYYLMVCHHSCIFLVTNRKCVLLPRTERRHYCCYS